MGDVSRPPREADDAYKATSKELGNDVQGARADYLRAAKAVDNAHPTESEDAALRKLVERHSLCDGDALADARDVAALRKRALAKAGIYDDEEDDVTEDDERVLKHVFAEEPRGRLVRGPFDPWPAIERAERAHRPRRDAAIERPSRFSFLTPSFLS